MAVIQKNEVLIPFLGSRLAFITGLDPMGSTNIGEAIYSRALPGLTSVTDRIRYYSFYCWFFDKYASEVGDPNPKEQRKLIRRAEYLLALIAAKNHWEGYAGITKAQAYYSEDLSILDLKEGTGESSQQFDGSYWANPQGVFGDNYKASMRTLGLIIEGQPDVYIRSEYEDKELVSGKLLGDGFAKSIGNLCAKTFWSAIRSGEISRDSFEMLSSAVDMKRIPSGSEEQVLLVKLLTSQDLPRDVNETYLRKESIRILLNYIKTESRPIGYQDLLKTIYENKGAGQEDTDTLMAWYHFQLNQYWHMVITATLAAVLKALREKSDGSWCVEKDFLKDLSEDVYKNLKSQDFVSSNWGSVVVSDIGTHDLAKSLTSGTYIERLSNSILLLRILMHDNHEYLSDLSSFERRYRIRNTTHFIAKYDELNAKAEEPFVQFYSNFLLRHIIQHHQFVAMLKMNASQSTEKLLREDGLIRLVDEIGFGFSDPRINTLMNFLNDLGILVKKEGTLTDDGNQLLAKLNLVND